MAKNQPVYVCSDCGGEALKWQGQCPHCNAWNTLQRLSLGRPAAVAMARGGTDAQAQPLDAATADAAQGERFSLGSAELDRVFGGGMTRGSASLLGGEPGIGKSTLLLQVAAAVAASHEVLYASGEESAQQVGQRAIGRLVELQFTIDGAARDIESHVVAACGIDAARIQRQRRIVQRMQSRRSSGRQHRGRPCERCAQRQAIDRQPVDIDRLRQRTAR